MRTNHLSAAGLLGIAGLHAHWAAGGAWPFADRAALAGGGAGRSEAPGAAACLAVSAALTAAATFVGGRPRSRPALQRAGATGVVSVLSVRGGLGLAGRTDLIAPGSTSAAFRARDRRIYSPLCLSLAAAALPACRR